MKKQFKKIIFALVFLAALVMPFFNTSHAYAASPVDSTVDISRGFLGLKPWYDGLTVNGGQLVCVKDTDEGARAAGCMYIATFILTIASNIAIDLVALGTYLALGFVIYGGYKYIFSNGDPGSVASGKKTIINTSIGLGILLLSNVIFTSVRYVLCQSAVEQEFKVGDQVFKVAGTANAGTLFTDLVAWVAGLAGIIAVIFLVIAGVAYMTAEGDAGKIVKARNTIKYSLIGLIIVMLSELFVAFINNSIRSAATPTSYVNSVEISLINKGE